MHTALMPRGGQNLCDWRSVLQPDGDEDLLEAFLEVCIPPAALAQLLPCCVMGTSAIDGVRSDG